MNRKDSDELDPRVQVIKYSNYHRTSFNYGHSII